MGWNCMVISASPHATQWAPGRVSCCASAFRFSDSWFSRWGLWGGPPGAIILMMAWSALLVCAPESLLVSRGSRLLYSHSSHEITPSGSMTFYSLFKKKLFHLHRNLPNLTLSPTHKTGKINCIMPILYIRIIYSREVDLPKMQSVVGLPRWC